MVNPVQNWLHSDSGKGTVLALAPFSFTMVMLVAPLATIIVYSFWTQDYYDIDRTFTWANYAEFWSDPIYRALLLRSLRISLLVTAATVILAFPVAYFISFNVRPESKATWLFIVTIPFWTSYLLRIFAWKIILGFNGVMNTALLYLGLIDEPLTFLLYNTNAIVLTLTHAWVAFAVLPIFVSLEKIDRTLLEAASDLGDGTVRRFLRITLPLALPGVIAATLIIFIPTIGDYITPSLVGGKDGVMIANMIQLQIGPANDWPLGAALAIVSMLAVTVISVLWVIGTRLAAARIR